MNILYFVQSFLKSIDIFGIKTDFQINQQSKFKTVIGGIFTLFFGGIVLFLFLSIGKDMINRSNPLSVFSQIFDTYPKGTSLSKNDYFFTFGLQDGSGSHFYDDTIYTIDFIHFLYNQTVPFVPIKNKIPFERCRLDHLPEDPELKSYFNKSAANLNDLLCLKQGYDNQFDILGTWDTELFHQITIKINKCVNSTLTPERICKSKEEIEKKIGSSYFAFYSTDYLIDVRNFSNPAQRFGRNYYIETSLKVQKSILRTISDSQVITDQGWIIDEVKKSTYPTFYADRESFNIGEFTTICSFSLRKSNYVSIYTRSYKKIQNVMADMGGFIQIALIILFFGSYFFVRREYFEAITNQIYNFEKEDASKNKEIFFDSPKSSPLKISSAKSKEEIKLKTFKTLIQGEEPDQSIRDKVSVKGIHDKKKKEEKLVTSYLKKQDNPLNITFSETIKNLCSTNDNVEIKKQQQKKGINSIFKQLDITYVLKKFQEFEKLKMLLLDENQFHLFEFLPKPVILKNSKINLNYGIKSSIDKKSSMITDMISHDDDVVMKAKIVRKSYGNIIKKTDLSEIDKKLIDFLDEDIKNLLLLENNPGSFNSSNKLIEIDTKSPEKKDDHDEKSIFQEKEGEAKQNIEKYL